jgi:hypothetical protein
MMQAVRATGLPREAAALLVEHAGSDRRRDPTLALGGALAPGGAHHHLRARAAVAGLVLSHRLRARLGPRQQAGMREQAARVIGLTARLWLG